MKQIPLSFLTILFCFGNVLISYGQETSTMNKLKCSKYINDGIEKYNLGRTYDAFMLFKQAVAVDPNSWKALYQLATTEYDINNFSEAKQHIDASISLSFCPRCEYT